ncbi:hypothetical protein ALQ96_102165 [Pseudomonas syringae pv. atrofaciens]|jgi:hypothetical protein|nr:Hypothetical protein PSSB64_0737 [Pseudomonas syringae pv. syringae B64]RML33525.1 hypothetical protein ALQ96_102165 [Pseudomonas syringae pv. atrofaciens]
MTLLTLAQTNRLIDPALAQAREHDLIPMAGTVFDILAI